MTKPRADCFWLAQNANHRNDNKEVGDGITKQGRKVTPPRYSSGDMGEFAQLTMRASIAS
jgi:hypothetical protein